MHRGRATPRVILIVLLALAVVLLLWGRWNDNPSSLTGTVADADGFVAGARVRIQGSPGHALTDAAGRFTLAARPGHGRITAWLEGYFIAGIDASSDPLHLQLKPLPEEDCERYAWVDPAPDPARPQNCGNCHNEIYREWLGSGHARAATGLHFRNLFDGSDGHGRPNRGWSLLADHPDGAGVCTACHAPAVSFLDPAYFDLRQVRGVAAGGVHCDYCHKVSGVAGEVGVTHGRFGLKLLRPEEGQLFFGPLDDVDRGEDAHLPLYRHSRYCAPCHEGTVFGVHVYSTYSEWLDSPARRQGKECQTCHMTPTGRMTNIAPGRGGIARDPATLGNHHFFAGSLRDMLRASLRLDVTSRREGEAVTVEVVVEARDVGHRVPTGFVDRNLVLQVEAVAAEGRAVVPVDGPRLPDAAGRELRGQAGKLYAKLLKDFDGRRPAPFWRADPEIEDTRLRPHQPDRLRFRFPAETERVRARLLYRRFWPEVAEQKSWPDNEILVAEQVSR
jgi:hypothetical protein